MSISVGASSNALSYLQSLLQQGTAGASGPASTSDPLSMLMQSLSGSSGTTDTLTSSSESASGTSGSAFPPFGAGTMAALLSLQGQSTSGVTAQSSSQLFAKLDADGDGQISKSEFESALGNSGVSTSTADALFAKLDANGDSSISQSELTSAKHGHHHHHMHGGGESGGSGSSGQNAIDTLLSSAGADGATTKAATNADGSTTTTISYADGSTVDMTTPAVSTNGSGSASTGASGQNTANLLEQLIQMQAQLLTSAASTLSAVA